MSLVDGLVATAGRNVLFGLTTESDGMLRGKPVLRSGLRPFLRPSLRIINRFSHTTWYDDREGGRISWLWESVYRGVRN